MEEEGFKFTYQSGMTFTEEFGGQIKCGGCNKLFKRIVSHLENNKDENECGSKLDINILKIALKTLKNKRSQAKHRINEKIKNINASIEKQNLYKERSKQKLQEENKEKINENQRKWRAKCDRKAKEEDEKMFKDNQIKRRAKCDRKAKEEDEEMFKENQRKRRAKCHRKAKEEDKETVKENQRKRKAKCVIGKLKNKMRKLSRRIKESGELSVMPK